MDLLNRRPVQFGPYTFNIDTILQMVSERTECKFLSRWFRNDDEGTWARLIHEASTAIPEDCKVPESEVLEHLISVILQAGLTVMIRDAEKQGNA